MKRVFSVAVADFTERRRRFSFLAVVALSLFAAYFFVPNSNFGTLIVEPDIFVQGGHSSWLPTTSAWGYSICLSLIGFFYISGSLGFDTRTGVSQYAVTTPMSGFVYLFSKYVSNFLLLMCMVLTVFVGSLVMALIHFPGQGLPLYSAVSIFLPSVFAAALIAALAVLFEASRVLSKNIGAVVYFAIWAALLTVPFSGADYRATDFPLWLRLLDVNSLTTLYANTAQEVLAQTGQPLQHLNFMAGGALNATGAGTQTLIFHGIQLTWEQITVWLGQIAVSVAMVGLAAPIYKLAGDKKRTRKTDAKNNIDEAVGAFSLADYRPGKIPKRFNLFGGLFAEIKLMLAGMSVLWYAVAAAGMALCAFLPMEAAWITLMILPVWFIGVFSEMGCREYEHNMLQCVAVLPSGWLRQILCAWISGVLMLVLITAPFMIRLVLAGNFAAAFSCVSGAVFIPSLALFLGEWTRTRRTFTIVFIILAYLNLNYVPALMYFEFRPEYLSLAHSCVFLMIGLSLGLAGILKRTRLIQV